MKIKLKILLTVSALSMTNASASDRNTTESVQISTHEDTLVFEPVGSHTRVGGLETETARVVELGAKIARVAEQTARKREERARIEAENTRLEGEIDRALDEMALLRGLLGGRGGAQRNGKER